jgi:ribosomal protein S18 acetylase RimI-like enzyme
MKRAEAPIAEAFLRDREPRCVSACARFLQREAGDDLWTLPGENRGTISALLLNSRGGLFPVFDGQEVPVPHFINRFLGRISIYAIQGSLGDTEILGTILTGLGYQKSDQYDYDLMNLDREPPPESLCAGPPDLILHRPTVMDMAELFPIQAAYEQEEVLPRDAEFNAAACRLNLEHILDREQMLIARLNGRIVGKINTNAQSFSRVQIGGVYVHPDYRGLGIATRMTAAFAGELRAQGRGPSLFVKKRNAAARRTYQETGFVVVGDYRICYY